jgi:hypothetical protein
MKVSVIVCTVWRQLKFNYILGLQIILKEKNFPRFVVPRQYERCVGKDGMLYVQYMLLLLYYLLCKGDQLLTLEYIISAFQVIRYAVLEKCNVFIGTLDPNEMEHSWEKESIVGHVWQFLESYFMGMM